MIGRFVVGLVVLVIVLWVLAFALVHAGILVVLVIGALGYALWRRRADG